jgi:ribosome-binding factor A
VNPRRSARLGEEIREEVAEIIASKLKDPRIGFVTVTRVEMTSDQELAKIYVGVLGDEKQRKETLVGLKQASGFVRRALAQNLKLRRTPNVVFHYDKGLDATDRVAQLLAEANAGAAGASDPDPDEDPD